MYISYLRHKLKFDRILEVSLDQVARFIVDYKLLTRSFMAPPFTEHPFPGGQTKTSENITLPQRRSRSVINWKKLHTKLI